MFYQELNRPMDWIQCPKYFSFPSFELPNEDLENYDCDLMLLGLLLSTASSIIKEILKN